ncbi:MAG TPA: hypothetical protein VFV27_06530, partial [Nevskiaceae bacterium]|nr:hypothetical protein [Nevskiaceae bacterium]
MNLITAVSRASLVAALFTSALATAGTTVSPGPIQAPTTSLSVGVDGSNTPVLGGSSNVSVTTSPPPIVVNADGSVTLP